MTVFRQFKESDYGCLYSDRFNRQDWIPIQRLYSYFHSSYSMVLEMQILSPRL